VWKIFDYVTIQDYEAGYCDIPYVERWSYLMEQIPSQYLAYNMESLEIAHDEMFLDKVTKAGYEGIVSVDYFHKWKATSSRRWEAIKWKKRPTADLLCVGVKEGEGKYDGMIGSLLLTDKEGLSVYVGSGLTDEDRLKAPEHFINKVVEIEYEQKMDTYIQPTFIRIRDDKEKHEID
jgi:ATP-dependent DNA ligase